MSIRLLLTVDVEGTKHVSQGRLVHEDIERQVKTPWRYLQELATRRDLPLTFFLPLSELEPDFPEVATWAKTALPTHSLGLHLHRPFARLSLAETVSLLTDERRRFENRLGYAPSVVRAGTYNTGKHRDWFTAVRDAGLPCDSSLLSGSWTGAPSLRGQAETETARWGPRGYDFDHRRVAAAGLFSPLPGSPLRAVPISVFQYSEMDFLNCRLDPQRLTLPRLREGFLRLSSLAPPGGELVVVAMFHTTHLLAGCPGGRPRWSPAVSRLADWIAWLKNQEVRWDNFDGLSRFLARTPGEGSAVPYHAVNGWQPKPRPPLPTPRQCPRCRKILADREDIWSCPACRAFWHQEIPRLWVENEAAEHCPPTARISSPSPSRLLSWPRAARALRRFLQLSYLVLASPVAAARWIFPRG